MTRFEYPNLPQETAFDDAVKDVDGIIHTASPVHLGSGEPSGKLKLTCITCLNISSI